MSPTRKTSDSIPRGLTLRLEKGSPTMAFTHTTETVDKAWAPDVTTFAPEDVVGDALIIQTATKAGVVEGDQPVVRCAFIDDDDAEFVAEGSEIPESEPDLAECLVATGKVSQLIRMSREAWTQDGTAGQPARSVARAVTRRADLAYVQQVAPTPPALGPSAGLAHVAGIVDGGDVSANLDALVDWVAELQTNLSNPTHILLSPTAWAEFRKLKVGGADTNSSLIGAGTNDAQQLLLSLPVLVNVAVPVNTGFVLDQSSIVAAYGTISVATSEHQYVSSDSVAVRCTWGIGHNVVRPAGLACSASRAVRRVMASPIRAPPTRTALALASLEGPRCKGSECPGVGAVAAAWTTVVAPRSGPAPFPLWRGGASATIGAQRHWRPHASHDQLGRTRQHLHQPHPQRHASVNGPFSRDCGRDVRGRRQQPGEGSSRSLAAHR